MFTFFTRAVANPGYVNLGREQPQSWGHQSVILTNPPPQNCVKMKKKQPRRARFLGAPMDPPMQGVCKAEPQQFPLSL